MSPLASYGQPMMDEPEPAGYEHGPMGEMGEAPHYGEVIPFPLAPPEPESVTKLKQQAMLLMKLAKMPNVADAVTDEELGKLGSIVVREFRIDEDSRADWEKSARRAMDIARQKVESKSYPWDGASNVKFPMLTTAALQFAARAYPAIVDGPRIVKCQVMGRDPAGLKAAMADRVSQHMSYQLLEEDQSWEEQHDRLLINVPIVKHHGLFQLYYYGHFVGEDRNARDRLKDHEYYDACVEFCDLYDQESFDPEYDSLPLEFFEPILREVFAAPRYLPGHSATTVG